MEQIIFDVTFGLQDLFANANTATKVAATFGIGATCTTAAAVVFVAGLQIVNGVSALFTYLKSKV